MKMFRLILPLLLLCAANASAGETKSIVFQKKLATPGAPTVTPGTAGVVTWGYKIAAVDFYGGITAVGTEGTATEGEATLGAGAHKNALTWTAVTSAVSYKIYRTSVGTSPSTTGLIGTSVTAAFDDTGLAGDSATPPSTSTSGKGPRVAVIDYTDINVQVDGTFVGTIQIEGTVDGTNWYSVGSASTGAARVVPTPTLAFLRSNCTAYTSGTPVITIGAQRRR